MLQPVSSVTNKSVIPEVFYRESIAEYGFPIKDFGNDELLVGYELTGCNTSLLSNIFPDSNATRSGLNGDSPAAIKSAFTKLIHFPSFGRNDFANVVLPAPFGPATM